MSYTTGPWEVGNWDARCCGYEIRSGSIRVGRSAYLGGTKTALINARLMAAAPDLYEALEWIADSFAPDDEALINQVARTAIAKAKGDES